MENIKFEEVQSLLDSGKDPEEIFDKVEKCVFYKCFLVELNGKINCLNSKDNKLLSPDLWFDECIQKGEGLLIRVGDKYNFLNKIGKFISDWFDEYIEYSTYRWNLIRRGNEWNTVSKYGYMVNKQWFDKIIKDYEIPRIRKGEKYNYIGYAGQILSDIWFDTCKEFDIEMNRGFATLNGETYWVDTDGDVFIYEQVN